MIKYKHIIFRALSYILNYSNFEIRVAKIINQKNYKNNWLNNYKKNYNYFIYYNKY